ncbi:uncharacterized protein LOC111708953, partial [Eurytemora carolleeae]|uniref:uncharacterized protein LOC111708953 n=1 Tax=Eurytemora carolleeae TaxID=1294199 RepID=UPI000C785A25
MLSLGFLLLFMNGVQSQEEMNDHPCCPQIFLQSSGVLGSTQSSVLGIYTISNQKLANTPHPVYTKSEEETQFHVYFRVKSYGPQGWVVGGDLLEDSFYIATGQSTLDCPDGIVGGLYGENQTVVDEKFSIECHSDQVKIPCCESVNISATGVIGEHQG